MTDLSKSASPSEPQLAKMVGCEALRNGNEHFGIHDRNNFCEQRGCVAEPRRDDEEYVSDLAKRQFGMWKDFKDSGQWQIAEAVACSVAHSAVRHFASRASAAPLKQTDDVKELAREVAYTLAVESLSPVRRQILTIVFERVCKSHGFTDLLGASLPQPSAGQTEGK